MKKQKVKSKMTNYKKTTGITLIALVVTIIVLLILAGISISMLSGDNSILQKATDAKTNTNNAQIKERVQLAYTAAIADGKGELTETNLRTELTNEFGDNYDLDENTTTNEWIISVNEIERLRVKKGTTEEQNPIIEEEYIDNDVEFILNFALSYINNESQSYNIKSGVSNEVLHVVDDDDYSGEFFTSEDISFGWFSIQIDTDDDSKSVFLHFENSDNIIIQQNGINYRYNSSYIYYN